MTYKTLRVLSYDHSININDEYKRRLTGPSTMKSELMINPNERDHKSTISYPIFFVSTIDILSKSTKILQNSSQIQQLINRLPNVASEQFFYQTLIKEIYSTNEIEGVRSTKQEISDAIASVLNASSNKRSRFHSLAYMYLRIKNGESIHIDNPKKIRDIWEDVTAGEVKKDDQPDGKLFRAKTVYIRDSTTMQAIHWPHSDENLIIRDITSLIDFMNNDNVPFIPKALISHFYFEYIHPFYDGNGRTGRYLACAYLGKKLDYLTGINFSYSISENKKKYYKAFEETEHPKNFGDATFFIESLMDIIADGQQSIINALTESVRELDKWGNALRKSDFNEQQQAVLFLLIQVYLFGVNTNISLSDNEIMIANKSQQSQAKTKRAIDNLEVNNWIELIKERPKIHKLSQKFVDLITREINK